jgi:hypothetical protein
MVAAILVTERDGMLKGNGVETRWCPKCDQRVAIGPSNDEPETVSADIRGAALAANWRDQSYRPGDDRFDWCPETKSDELCDLCQAHVLAHATATHDEEQ